MRLCLLSRFFDLRNAGVGRYSMELVKRLEDRGVEVEKVSQDGGVPLGEGMLKYFFYTAFEVPFKVPESDVYHALTPLESIHAPRPLVVTFHDFIPILYLEQVETHYASSKIERWFTSNYFRIACETAVRKADSITAVSQQTKEELVQEFGVDKEDVKVIRHGINPDLEPREKEDDVFRIGTLSFLGPRKRIDLLIRAFLEADIDGELLIAGEGRDLKRLEKIAGGDDRIKFLGFVPEEEVVDFFNSLDVFAFPSKLEGYGLPAVEAMACKTPVVTLSDAVIPDDVQDRTIVVDDLEEWFEDLDFSEIDIEKNYEFAEKHDWKECAEEHAEVYGNLV